MKANKTTLMSLVKTCFVVLTLTGCVKKRPDLALQGSGLANGDVVTKQSVLNVNEKVLAKEKVQDATTREYKLTIEPSAKNKFDDLGYVNYETESVLLNNNPRFIGRPGVEYTLKRELQGDRLLIYKVSKPENISYIEKTNLVKKYDNGMIGVPFLAFPVSYYNIRKLKDADNRKTNQKTEMLVVDPHKHASATHILVRWADRIDLTQSSLDKSSMFPKSFFKDSEWYFSVFKTNSSDYQAGGNRFEFIHTKNSNQFGIFRNVKFQEMNQDTFAAVSAALPEEVKDNALSHAVVAPLKVKWIKLRVNTALTGSESEQIDTSGDYRNAEYFQINFIETFKAMSKDFAFGDGGDYNVKNISEVIIADDLFSFIVESDKEQYRVNFLKKKNSHYKELISYYKDTLKNFGVSHMGLPMYSARQKIQVEDDLYRYYRTVRFNPATKVITYHISEESPNVPAVQKSAERGVKYIDDAFKHIYRDKPQDRIRVVLSEKRVRSGDPRYNIIDYNSKNNTNTYGGLGNPYYDEKTGEVKAATTYVYYGITNALLKSSLTEYMGLETGIHLGVTPVSNGTDNLMPFQSKGGVQYQNNLVYMPAEYTKNFQSLVGNTTLSTLLSVLPGQGNDSVYLKTCLEPECNYKEKSAQEHLQDVASHSKPLNLVQQFQMEAVNNAEAMKQNRHKEHNVFSISRRSSIKTFNKFCDMNAIKRIYTQLGGSSEFLERKEVSSCFDTILTEMFTPTVVHEILHNLGMTHNMQGSTDKDNYLTPELIKQVYGETLLADQNPSQTNSIMDYFEYRTEDSPYPGQYDWAVLRYLYRNQVQMADGRIVDLAKKGSQKLLSENVVELRSLMDLERAENTRIKKYSYCLEAEMNWGANPLCDTFDIGHNPLTIVKNYIEEYNYYTTEQSRRGLRQNYDVQSINRFKGYLLHKILNYYSHWRKELINLTGEDNKYLERYKTADEFYNDFGSKLLSLPKVDQKRVLEYYQVRNKIYSFLRDEVFKAPYTCVYKQEMPGFENFVFLDFDQVYRKMLSMSVSLEIDEVAGCKSPAVQKISKMMLMERIGEAIPMADVSDIKLSYVADVGVPMKNYSTNLYEARNLPGSFDMAGYLGSKFTASNVLLNRQFTPYYNSDEYFLPTFMDEPEFRDNFEFFLKNRLVNGFWMNDVTSDIRAIKINGDVVNEILSNPEHVGFKVLLSSYGNDGARKFVERLEARDLVTKLNDGNQDLFDMIIGSPYFQNFTMDFNIKSMEEKLQRSLDVEELANLFSDTYQMGFANSYVSENLLIPIYANMFRAGLNVPNNLSVSARRTERFQMGMSSNDYAYIEFVRNRYQHVADLGSFLVYPKNDESTFARDLIIELDSLNSYGQGFADPEVDAESVTKILTQLMDKFLSDKVSAQTAYEALPTIEMYSAMSNRFIMSLNLELSKNKDISDASKNMIANMANKVLGMLINRVNSVANQRPIEAYDRLGNKLKYTEALNEVMNLKQILDSMKEGVPLPGMTADKAHFQKTYNDLVKVLTKFQSESKMYLKIETPLMDNGMPDLVFSPVVSSKEIESMIHSEVQRAMERNIIYRFDTKEYDTKKELLNKFLFMLAISR